MGRHMDEVLRMMQNGQIYGERAAAALAEEAIALDAEESEAAGGRIAASRWTAPRRVADMSDSEIYSLLYPTVEEAQQRGDALTAAAEARMRTPLSDAEYEAMTAARAAHVAFSGLHSHAHSDYRGGLHTHVHEHQGEAAHDHHEYGDSLPG
jgi:hypothetical protein